MQDVLHPIFDAAYDVLGIEHDDDGKAVRTFVLDDWARDQIRKAVAGLQAQEIDAAAVALCALAEVVKPHNVMTATELRAIAEPLSKDIVRALPRHAATQRAKTANVRYSRFIGAAGPKFSAPTAPRAGAHKVGLGVRFRLNQ